VARVRQKGLTRIYRRVYGTGMTKTEIACNCKVCKTNAAKLGLTAPLRAKVQQATLDAVRGKTHGLVYIAHDPSSVGRAARAAAQIEAL
jgi:hypothetical protein